MLSIDPTRNGKHSILIGDQLRKQVEAPKRALISVQFNHKPKLASPPQKTTIIPSRHSSDNSCNLTISANSDGNNYLYAGSQQTSSACALIYDPTSKTITLDKISTDFSFNLRATPSNKNSKTLATQYPQLETNVSTSNSDSEDLFNDPSAQIGDTDNPYDYRHFLNKRRRTSSPSPQPTPPISTAPIARCPSRTKPKPKPRAARPQKRAPSPPPTREEADADNEDSDPDILTIEIEPDAKPRGRFAGAFSYDKRNGPISLCSAASSVSPAGVRLPEHNNNNNNNNNNASNDHPNASESESLDEDMEELLLPSPTANVDHAADNAMNDEGIATPGGEMEEDDDDGVGELEKELEEALESQADEDGGVGVGLGVMGAEVRRAVESSSESEEE